MSSRWESSHSSRQKCQFQRQSSSHSSRRCRRCSRQQCQRLWQRSSPRHTSSSSLWSAIPQAVQPRSSSGRLSAVPQSVLPKSGRGLRQAAARRSEQRQRLATACAGGTPSNGSLKRLSRATNLCSHPLLPCHSLRRCSLQRRRRRRPRWRETRFQVAALLQTASGQLPLCIATCRQQRASPRGVSEPGAALVADASAAATTTAPSPKIAAALAADASAATAAAATADRVAAPATATEFAADAAAAASAHAAAAAALSVIKATSVDSIAAAPPAVGTTTGAQEPASRHTRPASTQAALPSSHRHTTAASAGAGSSRRCRLHRGRLKSAHSLCRQASMGGPPYRLTSPHRLCLTSGGHLGGLATGDRLTPCRRLAAPCRCPDDAGRRQRCQPGCRRCSGRRVRWRPLIMACLSQLPGCCLDWMTCVGEKEGSSGSLHLHCTGASASCFPGCC